MEVTLSLAASVGLQEACRTLGVSRATLYRQRPRLGPAPALVPDAPASPPRPTPARKLTEPERQQVLDVLHEERFQDCAPAAVHATLLDEGRYLCSVRTMYRVLDEQGETRERREQLIHPPYQKPELLATAPNQLWSWDITKLRGPVKWTYFYLYVVLDVFSRYVTGWMVAERETGELAKHLLEQTIGKYDIPPGQLNIHADRGRPMIAKPVAHLLADLGVTKSHSRPYVSDDNPFSESQFRTLKYRPDFPDRFGCNSRRPRARSALLPLVQRRASALRDRHADPSDGHTLASPNRRSPSAKRCSMRLMLRGPNASSANLPLLSLFLGRSGSTSHPGLQPREKVTKFPCRLSQKSLTRAGPFGKPLQEAVHTRNSTSSGVRSGHTRPRALSLPK